MVSISVMKRFLPKSTLLLAMLIFVSSASFPCTYFPPEYKVQPSFKVKVKSGVRPFAKVRVVLERIEGEPNFRTTVAYSSYTDEHGVAHFEGIASGEYSVGIDQLGAAGWDTAYVKVAPDNAVNDVELKWPSSHILEVSTVSGRLIDSRTAKPAAEFILSLVNGLTGTRLSSLVTDTSGQFNFGTPESGLYFLKVEPEHPGDWEPKGEIPVFVGPEGKKDILLAVGETSCGMMYSEICPAPLRSLSALRGEVVDSQGAPIPRAKLELSSKNGPVRTFSPGR